MSKPIKVTDELYYKLKTLADNNGRTITGQIDYMANLNSRPTYSAPTMTHMDNSPKVELFDESLLYRNTPVQTDIEEKLSKRRTRPDILKDIDGIKAIMKEEVDWCQDAETKRKIELSYGAKIDALWVEYNGIDK